VRGRSSLDRGELCLYLVKGRGRFTLVRLALRSLLGRLDQDRDFRGMCLPGFRVDTPRRLLPVAADGEVLTLRPPFQYRVRPGALRVILPAREQV
jgi:diacylglycerol kinase family enzyme